MNVVLDIRPISEDRVIVFHILADVVAILLWLNGVSVAGQSEDCILIIHVLTDAISACVYLRKRGQSISSKVLERRPSDR